MSRYIVVDVESDGPCPGKYSMVCFGAVVVEEEWRRRFYGEVRPISQIWNPDALAISGVSREKHLEFPLAETVMPEFFTWCKKVHEKPVFISDNPAFDFQWINYYFHTFTDLGNPFGHSARRISDIYSGCVRNMGQQSKWKSMRRTRHTHNPIDDAMGNIEALLEIFEKYEVKW